MNFSTQDLKNSLANSHTNTVKQIALELGFDFCGISKADFLENEATKLENWLSQNKHGQMNYMANHFDMRLDPRLLVDGAESVICLAYNYFTDQPENQNVAEFQISKYAYGQDYHKVIKTKLKQMMRLLEEKLGFRINGRVFTDSAPILEKAWATKSGLGWIGKNSNLISRKQGSFMFLAEIISDLRLIPDSPIRDFCGTCTRCIDACPTQAITEPYSVDGSRCISYFTIELKDALPNEIKSKFENWIFGCDICQDVCPWNRFSKRHQEPAFEPSDAFKSMKKQDWIEITESVFEQIFDKSAVKRTGYKGLKRNIDFLNQTVQADKNIESDE